MSRIRGALHQLIAAPGAPAPTSISDLFSRRKGWLQRDAFEFDAFEFGENEVRLVRRHVRQRVSLMNIDCPHHIGSEARHTGYFPHDVGGCNQLLPPDIQENRLHTWLTTCAR